MVSLLDPRTVTSQHFTPPSADLRAALRARVSATARAVRAFPAPAQAAGKPRHERVRVPAYGRALSTHGRRGH